MQRGAHSNRAQDSLHFALGCCKQYNKKTNEASISQLKIIISLHRINYHVFTFKALDVIVAERQHDDIHFIKFIHFCLFSPYQPFEILVRLNFLHIVR